MICWSVRTVYDENVKNRIFFKLLAVFLIVIAATAAILDVMIGGAWESSLRTEIERNLTQKTLLFAHRVETDRTHTLAEIAAQEGSGRRRPRHHHRRLRKSSRRLRIQSRRHGEPRHPPGIRRRSRRQNRRERAPQRHPRHPISLRRRARSREARFASPIRFPMSKPCRRRSAAACFGDRSVAFFIALLIAATASVWTSRRLERIVDVAARIEQGDLQARVEDHSARRNRPRGRRHRQNRRPGRTQFCRRAFQPAPARNPAQQHAGRRHRRQLRRPGAVGQPAHGSPRSAAHPPQRSGRRDHPRSRFSRRRQSRDHHQTGQDHPRHVHRSRPRLRCHCRASARWRRRRRAPRSHRDRARRKNPPRFHRQRFPRTPHSPDLDSGILRNSARPQLRKFRPQLASFSKSSARTPPACRASPKTCSLWRAWNPARPASIPSPSRPSNSCTTPKKVSARLPAARKWSCRLS